MTHTIPAAPATIDVRAAVAVVGAGLSGLACARALRAAGATVAVFEKSRGPGGRAATRRVDTPHGALGFDHGAQYFTVRDPAFRRQVDAWQVDGVARPWSGRVRVLDRGAVSDPHAAGPERWVGVPGMSALGRSLAAELDVRCATRVAAVKLTGARWRLTGETGAHLGDYAALVVALPAPQAAPLLGAAVLALAGRADSVVMTPCWSAMLAVDPPLDLGFDAAFIGARGGRPAGSLGSVATVPGAPRPLAWVARDSSKPRRHVAGGAETWVLHASAEWSERHLELTPDEAAAELAREFTAECGVAVRPVLLTAHRWRFAAPREALAEPCLFDAALRVGACGDWCGGPRVEGAYLSGLALAARIVASGVD